MNAPDELAHLLGRPETPLPANGASWERLLSQARRATLAARLAWHVLDRQTVGDGAASKLPMLHLLSARTMADRLAQGMALEARQVAQALQAQGHRCVLLKGAAYLCAQLPPARGRVFGDLDILVPQAELVAVEDALLAGGWIANALDPYNQRYYRQWMHEIPPLTHVRRGSTIDVHHTIVPPTSVFRVDGGVLLDKVRPVGTDGLFWVLQPVDMVLHSAVHLFTEGEFDRGLRDLLDMHDLLCHFVKVEPDFWPSLLARAQQLGLQRPLHHMLRHVQRLFGDAVPPAQLNAVQALAPPLPQRLAMAWLLRHALRPPHPACEQALTPLARWLLFVRSHWLRMPLRLLVPHLVRKAWMRRRGAKATATAAALP